jgi:hypothetical protein
MPNKTITRAEATDRLLFGLKLSESKYGIKTQELFDVSSNIDQYLSELVYEFMLNDSIPESVVEEVLEETLKYMEFIQRRLGEITVDKP